MIDITTATPTSALRKFTNGFMNFFTKSQFCTPPVQSVCLGGAAKICEGVTECGTAAKAGGAQTNVPKSKTAKRLIRPWEKERFSVFNALYIIIVFDSLPLTIRLFAVFFK